MQFYFNAFDKGIKLIDESCIESTMVSFDTISPLYLNVLSFFRVLITNACLNSLQLGLKVQLPGEDLGTQVEAKQNYMLQITELGSFKRLSWVSN